MRVKQTWRVASFRRMCRAQHTMPTITITLKLDGRWQDAGIWPLDGKAVIVPTFYHRMGLLVVEWSKAMRFIRRHNLGPNA